MIFTSERAIAEGVARQVASRLVFLDVPAARVAEVSPVRNSNEKYVCGSERAWLIEPGAEADRRHRDLPVSATGRGGA